MKQEAQKIKPILFLLCLILLILFSFSPRGATATSTTAINATVKISVCGNNIAEDGEDCDANDLKGESCTSLGFSGGNLDCDHDPTTCSFDTTNCNVPSIDENNVTPDEVHSLVAAGHLNIPPSASLNSTPSVSTPHEVTISIPTTAGTSKIVLPGNVTITPKILPNFDPTELTTSNISSGSLSGFPQDTTVDGAVQFGLPDGTLVFDIPVTVTVYVGALLNGQTLNIVRSESTDSGWTTDGIVAPATCKISGGQCIFQTTMASYFATTHTGTIPGLSGSSAVYSSPGSAPGCVATPPSGAPDIFQIDVSDKTAKLYFSPAGKPFDRYFISFGLSANAEQYGSEFYQTNSGGVATYSVYKLTPDTTYYFKIRGGNGCATGSWSKVMKAKTNSRFESKVTSVYKNTVTAITSKVAPSLGEKPLNLWQRFVEMLKDLVNYLLQFGQIKR